ncbi:LTA synthase family protein [Chitinophaga tropicalis]|uniref:Sulfatase-like hydrolase/transferase n=1 Tax=Chitinophaga tropicalis TaxID=2683588 RepID=A0A7K1UBP6_9BACT|nr:alkaline phosphatase family protein [Chitinophaga tropicalis]MVT11812.1 sulfatase-like hydrolase/transferase [Chitinophaga tropicalis]
MKYLWKNIPKYIRYVIVQALSLFLLMVLFRLIFFFFFFQTTVAGNAPVVKAWGLGLRFDMRLALILVIPLLLFAVIWRNAFFTKPFIRLFTFIYLFIVYFLLIWHYIFDLGHFAYLGIRMDPSVFRFFLDGERADNARMLWQTYPILRTVAAVGLFLFLMYRLYSRTYRRMAKEKAVLLTPGRYIGWLAGTVIVFAAGIYANVAYFPLRWSQAMFTRDNGITSLALNPVLYFVSNLSVQKDTYDLDKTKKYYPVMAKYLGVENPDAEKLNFVRQITGADPGKKMNVILVMLESTGASVTSMYGNPMQATPNMKRLADSGILFRNFFVPAISTARTVYGVTTGLPDITSAKTASRHPQMVDQRVIMDQFKGYEKFYLLGGNTNWANIRAVFTNNVEGVKIYEEGYYKAPKADVWGVSDYDLITEADEIFRDAHQRKQPFIAFLQLADNHPPYTTSSGAGDFRKVTEKDLDMVKFKKAGFVSVDQFNALRYEDYNVGHLVDLARKSGYLENTVFIMFGDHNCTLNPYHFMPVPEYELASGGVHTTCFIYSPGFIKPAEISYPVSLVDVYPTMAKLVGMPVKNYTLGQDMLDSTNAADRYAFSIYTKNLQAYMSVIGERYQYEINEKTQSAALYDLKGDPLKDVKAQQPDTAKKLDNLTRAFYESTRYLMFNNKK